MTVERQRANEHDVEPRTLLVQYLREVVRPHRHEGRLRHVVVRRVHGARRRRVGEVVHDARGPGRRAARHDDRGPRAPDDELHPVQQAFHEHHGLQCGFCTAGMVMAAVSLLDEIPSPTERDVRLGLEGNLCRCTGYHNIVQAVLAAAGTHVIPAPFDYVRADSADEAHRGARPSTATRPSCSPAGCRSSR